MILLIAVLVLLAVVAFLVAAKWSDRRPILVAVGLALFAAARLVEVFQAVPEMNIDFYNVKWQEILWPAFLAALTALLVYLQGITLNFSDPNQVKAATLAGALIFGRTFGAYVWNALVATQKVVSKVIANATESAGNDGGS